MASELGSPLVSTILFRIFAWPEILTLGFRDKKWPLLSRSLFVAIWLLLSES